MHKVRIDRVQTNQTIIQTVKLTLIENQTLIEIKMPILKTERGRITIKTLIENLILTQIKEAIRVIKAVKIENRIQISQITDLTILKTKVIKAEAEERMLLR